MKWDVQTIADICTVVIAAATLGAIIQTGHGAMADRITAVETRLDTRIDNMGARLNARFGGMDARLDDIGERMAGVEAHLVDLSGRMYRVESHLFGVEPVENP